MTLEERIYQAISGEVPDRVPSIPKIWVDLASNLTNTPLISVIEDPLKALKVIFEAGLRVNADGVRQFHFPKRKTATEDNKVFEIDDQGRYVGEIDMEGGLKPSFTIPKILS